MGTSADSMYPHEHTTTQGSSHDGVALSVFIFLVSSDTGAFGRVTAFPHIGRYVMQLHRGRSATPRFRKAQASERYEAKLASWGKQPFRSLSASESEKHHSSGNGGVAPLHHLCLPVSPSSGCLD